MIYNNCCKDDEFLGVGVENGLLKLAWSWQGVETTVLTLPRPPVADGSWHDVTVSFTSNNVTVWRDRGDAITFANTGRRPLHTDGIIQLGKKTT